jgi:hypothetical protein
MLCAPARGRKDDGPERESGEGSGVAAGVSDPRSHLYLKDVQAHRPAERSRWADAIRAQEEAGAPVAGIWRLFAWKPALAVHLGRLAQEVLRGPSPLPPGFREMIAAFTSARNQCLF